MENFEVATWGGTLFVVAYEGVAYGLTAKHNLHDFEWRRLIVAKNRTSNSTAGLRAIFYAGVGLGAAEDSDLLDIAVIQFSETATPTFFGGTAFDLSRPSMCLSQPDDDLVAYGVPSEHLELSGKVISATYAELGFVDTGPNPYDPTLREAKGLWLNSSITSLAGMSGCPVFNVTRGGLCGMVLRGGIGAGGVANILYSDIRDIIHLLQSVHGGQTAGYYRKVVSYPS